MTLTGTGSMALRSGLAKWSTAWKLAAGLTAGSATYALCEDIRGPSFDPEALERGAKALREINASPYAKKVNSDQCRSVSPELDSAHSCGLLCLESCRRFCISWPGAKQPISAALRWRNGFVQMQVIDLSREQERSKQAESKKAEAEAQRAAQSYAIVRPPLGMHSSNQQ